MKSVRTINTVNNTVNRKNLDIQIFFSELSPFTLIFIQIYFEVLVSRLPLLHSKLFLAPSTLPSVLLAAKLFEKSIQHLDTTQGSTNKTTTPQT